MNETITLTVRFPKELYILVRNKAKAERRSMGNLIKLILSNFFIQENETDNSPPES